MFLWASLSVVAKLLEEFKAGKEYMLVLKKCSRDELEVDHIVHLQVTERGFIDKCAYYFIWYKEINILSYK